MRFIAGVIIGLLLIPAGFYLYVRAGLAPVATSDGPMPFERWMASTALHAKLQRNAPKDTVLQPTETNLVSGAQIYSMNCAECHGLPGQKIPDIAKSMFPRPPQLFSPEEMVTDDPPGVTFWKVKNGIRLSGMPAFGSSLSDGQLWQVALALAHADKLPSGAQRALSAGSGNGR